MTTIERKGQAPKILFIHRYVAPDIPGYGWMLPEIAEAAISAGYEAEIFSTRPSYRKNSSAFQAPVSEWKSGVFIRRIALPVWGTGDIPKAVAALWFTIRAFVRTLSGDYEIAMSATTPPVLLSRAVSIGTWLRGKRFVYHCQDIHPEIANDAGPFRWTWLRNVFRWLDRQTCMNAARIVVLSDDMRISVQESRDVEQSKIVVINNFRFVRQDREETNAVQRASALLGNANGVFRFVFAGNLGRFQGLSDLIDGFLLVNAERSVELVFIGSGSAEGVLQRKAAPGDQVKVRFLGQQSKAVADAIVGLADIAIISLRKELIRYAYPSKTMDYLAAGVGILAVIEPDSTLGNMIEEQKFGVVVSPGDVDGIARGMERCIELAPEWTRKRTLMKELADRDFGRVAVLKRWQKLFENLRDNG